MNPIEIRLDPPLVASLLGSISYALELLDNELATPADLPEDDDIMENFWKRDLLESQRDEVSAIGELFDEEFLATGRAVIAPDNMERVLRACSAIRLKLRDTALAELSDEALEQGALDDVVWTEDLQNGYAAYALFANLQELIIVQMEGLDYEEDFGEEADDGAGDL